MSTAPQNPRSLFLEAIDNYSPTDWPKFLDAACGDDVALREEVMRLLDAHARLGSFMDCPAGAVVVATDPAPCEQVGSIIDRYKLLEKIGEGGMGVVYVAEQIEPVRRKVALKIIKPGMDTRQVIARFEAERQALALMDHPNIARVLDAGTTEAGRPYFVMELVRGLPITDYCDKAKLTPQKRLELFVTVCQAVQHAHQKGIIHRDLKPTNVLVTLHDGTPVAKVIDFGVAKAIGQQLTDRTIYTAFTQMIGTPLYMSPEQAELSGLDVDTRSDVYSLGVLLYELLTGQTPFDKESLCKAGLDEVRRIIREEEPLRPSARLRTLGAPALSTLSEQRSLDERRLCQILRGELDWIVMKALEKDRNRRYESASSFAADVLRYLDDQPVQACPPSVLYRMAKLIQRHKIAITTVTTIALSLIIATVISVAYAFDARAARTVADQRLKEANEARILANNRSAIADNEKKQADADFRRALTAIDTILSKVAAREHRLSMTPEFEQVRRQLIDQAIAFYDAMLHERPNDAAIRFRKALAHRTAGDVYTIVDADEQGQRHVTLAVKLLEQLHKEDPTNEEYFYPLAKAWCHYGSFSAENEPLFNSIKLAERLLSVNQDRDQRVLYLRELAAAHGALGWKLASVDVEAARGHLQTSILLCANDPDSKSILGGSQRTLGNIAQTAGNLAETESRWVQATDAFEAYIERTPDVHIRFRLMQLSSQFGDMYAVQGRKQEAAKRYDRALQLGIGLAVHIPTTSRGTHYVENLVTPLAQCLQSDNPNAKVIEIVSDLINEHPQVTVLHYVRAKHMIRQGQSQEALAAFMEGTKSLPKRWDYHLYRGRLFVSLENDDEALQEYNLAVEDNPNDGWIRIERGGILTRKGKFDLAREDYRVAGDYWFMLKRQAWDFIKAGQYREGLAILRRAFRAKPDDLSMLTWSRSWKTIPACTDMEFRQGYLDLVEEMVKSNAGSPEAIALRTTILKEFDQTTGTETGEGKTISNQLPEPQ